MPQLSVVRASRQLRTFRTILALGWMLRVAVVTVVLLLLLNYGVVQP
jgi:hypothetical protein